MASAQCYGTAPCILPSCSRPAPIFLVAATNSRSRRSGRSEEHTSELKSLMRISYAVFCLKKKRIQTPKSTTSYTYHEIYTTRHKLQYNIVHETTSTKPR